MIQRRSAKALAAFALTAVPMAVASALVVSNVGATSSAAPVASVRLEPTTTVVAPDTTQLVTTTAAPTTTSTTIAPDISDAATAVQEVPWKRVSVTQCGCSVELPGATTQSSSSLPDGRPAHLVLAGGDGHISAALWTTSSQADEDRAEQLATVVTVIAGDAPLSGQTTSPKRAQATLIDGSITAKIDARFVGDKIVVLFIASSDGQGIDAASARYVESFRA